MKARARGNELILSFDSESDIEAFEGVIEAGRSDAMQKRDEGREEYRRNGSWLDIEYSRRGVVRARQIEREVGRVEPSLTLKRLRPSDVIFAIHTTLGVTPNQLKGKARMGEFVRARGIFYTILRCYTTMSYWDLSFELNRNHATAINGIRKTILDARLYDRTDDLYSVIRELNGHGYRLSEQRMTEYLASTKKP